MTVLTGLVEAMNEMTLGQLAGDAALLFVIFTSLVEVTPIKINPITAVLRWFGNKINGPLMERLDDQDEKMDELRDSIDDNEIDRIRWEILVFANSCREGQRHTLDEFDHIIELNEKYHKILKRRNLTNGKIDLEYRYIVKIYENCQATNDFE